MKSKAKQQQKKMLKKTKQKSSNNKQTKAHKGADQKLMHSTDEGR